MNEYLCKSSVLLIFFHRPETFKKVFDAVRRVKPPVLYLAQDGYRNENDMEGISACRKIVEEIDWECTVYKDYADTNLSCDVRELSAIDWAFESTDELIILEDDCVPTSDFFCFCDELLQKYKSDERVHMICGTERTGINQLCKDSYYFSYVAAGCGWATWKRVWGNTQKYREMDFLEDRQIYTNLKKWTEEYSTGIYQDLMPKLKKVRNTKTCSWEKILGVTMLLESRLVISPQVNLIQYIGNTSNAYHGMEERLMSKRLRELFEKLEKTYPLSFPLKHPGCIIRNTACEEEYRNTRKISIGKRIIEKIEIRLKRFWYLKVRKTSL